MKKTIAILFAALIAVTAFAQNKEYKASMFGIKSNGIIDNTASIQKALEYIGAQGGGTLVFNVGRYVTGSVKLVSNVDIKINEGAVIVGSSNIYNYRGAKAIFVGDGVENVTVSGKGVIDGQGPQLLGNIAGLKEKGFVPESTEAPGLLYFKNCKKISLKGFIYRNPAVKGKLYDQDGSEVTVDGAYTDTL